MQKFFFAITSCDLIHSVPQQKLERKAFSFPNKVLGENGFLCKRVIKCRSEVSIITENHLLKLLLAIFSCRFGASSKPTRFH